MEGRSGIVQMNDIYINIVILQKNKLYFLLYDSLRSHSVISHKFASGVSITLNNLITSSPCETSRHIDEVCNRQTVECWAERGYPYQLPVGKYGA